MLAHNQSHVNYDVLFVAIETTYSYSSNNSFTTLRKPSQKSLYKYSAMYVSLLYIFAFFYQSMLTAVPRKTQWNRCYPTSELHVICAAILTML